MLENLRWGQSQSSDNFVCEIKLLDVNTLASSSGNCIDGGTVRRNWPLRLSKRSTIGLGEAMVFCVLCVGRDGGTGRVKQRRKEKDRTRGSWIKFGASA